MSLTTEDIDRLVRLSRINLLAKERQALNADLPRIVEFVKQLGRGPTSKPTGFRQAVGLDQLRDDSPQDNQLTKTQLKRLAPDFQDDQIKIPAVFDDSEG